MEGLKDKVIVFAGAGGIATATAGYLGAGDAKVVIGDVVLASAELAAGTCADAGGEGVAAVADISDEEQVKSLIELALGTYGRIDGLFNVAANLSPESVSPGLVLTGQLTRKKVSTIISAAARRFAADGTYWGGRCRRSGAYTVDGLGEALRLLAREAPGRDAIRLALRLTDWPTDPLTD